MIIKAYAKVNLGLRILNKREDGYHNIETTLTTINLADYINLKEMASGIVIEAEGLNVPTEENLCYRAALIFKKKYGIEKGVQIQLTKNIPVGGGLGGGSSDAACVLKGMRSLFNLNIPDEELMTLGNELGSDIPFFIKGGAAYARGRGDELKFFKLPRCSLVIYYPGYPISTKWAYEEYDKVILTLPAEMDIIRADKKKKKIRKGFTLENDFEKVVFKNHPDLLDVKINLLAIGAFMVSLSGSGSCLFAVVDENSKKKVTNYLAGVGAHFFEVKTI